MNLNPSNPCPTDELANSVQEPLSRLSNPSEFLAQIDHKIAHKTMPAGALGRLIDIAKQMAIVQGSLQLNVEPISFWVFAADHGLAREPISAYPQDVTWQMVENFLCGGAAINCFARSNQFDLHIVNAGVAHDFGPRSGLIDRSMGHGTASMLHGPAMTLTQVQEAIHQGYQLIAASPAQVVGFGEMGIGNTSAAALLTAALTNTPVRDCAGRGTGLNDQALVVKIGVLEQVMTAYQARKTAHRLDVLMNLGGFEIAMMVGACLGAAAKQKLILIDGFIATSAALAACALSPAVCHYMVFAHQSAEAGHRIALRALNAVPLLNLGMRLGEGSGAALAVPLIRAAAAFFNDMASFDSAGVSR